MNESFLVPPQERRRRSVIPDDCHLCSGLTQKESRFATLGSASRHHVECIVLKILNCNYCVICPHVLQPCVWSVLLPTCGVVDCERICRAYLYESRPPCKHMMFRVPDCALHFACATFSPCCIMSSLFENELTCCGIPPCCIRICFTCLRLCLPRRPDVGSSHADGLRLLVSACLFATSV